MLVPMGIMSFLCVACGLFYPLVNKYLLYPATNAALNVTNYIDKMMGDGYAAMLGVSNIEVAPAAFSFWNPIVWLILFVVIFVAAFLVITGSKSSRGQILQPGVKYDPKYATFFSGEEELFSQVGGSDLFWGFKTDWKGYYKVLEGLHSGIVTDYAAMTVIATAIITLCMFIFMR
jgi:multicomponent Na+:H+ antiporter subunit D